MRVYQNFMDVSILYTQACIIMIKYIDFGTAESLLNNKYFGLIFCLNYEAFLLPNKKKNSRIKPLPLTIRSFSIQEIPVSLMF